MVTRLILPDVDRRWPQDFLFMTPRRFKADIIPRKTHYAIRSGCYMQRMYAPQ